MTVKDGEASGFAIRQRAVAAVERVFVGTNSSDLPKKVSSLFTLCRTAQTIAALRAVEDAGGVVPGSEVSALRDILRRVEILTQVSMRLALHWPRVLGLPADPALPGACLRAEASLVQALSHDMSWIRPGAGCHAPDVEQAAGIVRDLRDRIAGFELADRSRISGFSPVIEGPPGSIPPVTGAHPVPLRRQMVRRART